MLIYSVIDLDDLSNIPDWVVWIELRLDLNQALLFEVDKLFKYKIILTVRTANQGGKSLLSFDEIISLYDEFSDYDNVLFDVEYESLSNSSRNLLKVKHLLAKSIVSYHEYKCLDKNKLYKIKDFTIDMSFAYLKLAIQVNSLDELIWLTKFTKSFSGKGIIFVVMGQYGWFQRSLYSYFNSYATYIAPDNKATAKGQLTVSAVNLYRLNKFNNWKWGGLVGGKQVFSSLGLSYYNKYFSNNEYKAIYIPIYLTPDDVKSFFQLISDNKKLKNNLYGFSITMPFKELIPSLFRRKGIFNLFIMNKEVEFFNTDIIALLQCIKRIEEFQEIDSVMIYGTGSMAKLVLSAITNKRIYLAGRDYKKVAYLKNENKNIEIVDQNTEMIKIDLLINCTPIGMNGEDFEEETGIVNFTYMIDLPYSEEKIPVSERMNKNKYISGKTFWNYQSVMQLDKFKEKIKQ